MVLSAKRRELLTPSVLVLLTACPTTCCGEAKSTLRLTLGACVALILLLEEFGFLRFAIAGRLMTAPLLMGAAGQWVEFDLEETSVVRKEGKVCSDRSVTLWLRE